MINNISKAGSHQFTTYETEEIPLIAEKLILLVGELYKTYRHIFFILLL